MQTGYLRTIEEDRQTVFQVIDNQGFPLFAPPARTKEDARRIARVLKIYLTE